MSKINLVLNVFGVWLIIIFLAGCSQQASPVITFENTVLDFGNVRPGSNNIGEIKFTNTGKGVLKIREVERCCGVSAKVDKSEYQPGQSGFVAVTYPAANAPGKVNRVIYVNTNDKQNPRAQLNIKAEIEMFVGWEPKTMKLSPVLENAGCPEITIKSVDGKKVFSISKFVSNGNCITAAVDPAVKSAQFVLQPKVDISKLTKYPRGNISIIVNYSDTNEQADIITIVYSTAERFALVPRSLQIFYTNPQEPVKRSLIITKNYGGDFEIEKVYSKAGHIKVINQTSVAGGYKFELEITPSPVDSEGKLNDTLMVALKDGQEIEVTCRGNLSVPEDKSNEKKLEVEEVK